MNSSPTWFKVVAAVALLWNLLGCMAFWADFSMGPEEIAKLPQEHQALYAARPGWAQASTGVAVISGAIGCIGLLLAKRWALPSLVISTLAVVVQDFGLFVLAGGLRLAGPVPLILQSVVLVIAIALVILARKGIVKGWLR